MNNRIKLVLYVVLALGVCLSGYFCVANFKQMTGGGKRDESQANTLNMWIVSDNLRKGAATNAVQIAEYMKGNGLI